MYDTVKGLESVGEVPLPPIISYCRMVLQSQGIRYGERQVSYFVGVGVSRGPAAYTQPQISTTILLIIDKNRGAKKEKK